MDLAGLAAAQFRHSPFTFSALTAGPAGGEAVLFLHGFPEFADAWDGILNAIGGAGFRAVAFDQRGYSATARPLRVDDYALDLLIADVLAVAGQVCGNAPFHLVGHDWGGVLGWVLAARYPERLRSLAVLSTPHVDAFLEAATRDGDQMRRSLYIPFFRLPGRIAEAVLLARDAALLRRAYQGKPEPALLERDIRRLQAPGALTAALNWYRVLPLRLRIGPVHVSTLYIWSDGDVALGRTAAINTRRFVQAPYRFEVLAGRSHWLMHDSRDDVIRLLLEHLRAHQQTESLT